MKNKLKQNKAITLIALVITIIVLLILAGVTITSLTGNNGLLKRASDAKEEVIIAEEKDWISQAYYSALLKKRGEDVSAGDLENELIAIAGANKIQSVTKDGNIFTVTYSTGHCYTLNKDTGEITKIEVVDPLDVANLGDWEVAYVQTADGWINTPYYPKSTENPTGKTDAELETMGTIVARLYKNGGKVTDSYWEWDEKTDEDYEVTRVLDAYTLELRGTGEMGPVEYHDEINDSYWGWAAGEEAISITAAIISDGIVNIPDSCFRSTSLTNITIPDSVVEVGWIALNDTPWYNNQPDGLVYAGKVCLGYKGNMPNNGTLTIKDGTKAISNGAFWRNTELINVTLPNSLVNINENAFYDCFYLESITMPNGITSIGEGAFSDCGLTSITIPSSLTTLENYVFYSCNNLTNITIPNNITSIGMYTFSESGLTSVSIPNSVTSIGEGAFSDCGLTSITIPSSLTTIEDCVFGRCNNLTNVTIPNSITSIGEGAFAGCGFNSIAIPSSVTSIGGGAFSGCSNLNSITIPNGITRINYNLFNECTSLTQIVIPSSVTCIESFAFCNCGLTSVTIPSSVTNIEANAFILCELTTATFGNTSGWFITDDSEATSGTSLDLSNTSRNACLLCHYSDENEPGYCEYYWKKSQ